MQKGEELWCCPFCDKRTIKVWHIPSHAEYRRSRGSGQSGGSYFRTGEKVEVLSGCSECGNSLKEVKKELL